MSAVLDEVPLGGRVALIRLRSLGDCVLSTPAISLLKTARPDLHIGIVVDDHWAAIYQDNPEIDAVLQPRISALRAFQPSLVLNLHGGSTSARLTMLSGARWRAAWSHFRFRYLYNIHIPKAQSILGVTRTVHTAEHVASAIFSLGVTVQSVPRARLFAKRNPNRSPYAVIHPMASEPAKTWKAEGFRAIATFCKNEANLEPVFLGAPEDDLSAFQDYTIAQGQSLAETMSLIQGASCFIGNDSGPAHIAAAFGIPCTVLFGPSDPAIWGPWCTQSTVLQANPMTRIRVGEVVRAIGTGVHA